MHVRMCMHLYIMHDACTTVKNGVVISTQFGYLSFNQFALNNEVIDEELSSSVNWPICCLLFRVNKAANATPMHAHREA